MAIVVGYLVASVIAVAGVWLVAGRNFEVVRDAGVNLADLGGRHVGLLSGLAGYAVTGMVLLVTLGRSLSDTTSISYTTVVAMFFMSWMAFAGTAFLFANLADERPAADTSPRHGFDIAAGQFVGAAATLEFAFGLGWLALRPLFQAFGLDQLANLMGFVAIGIAFASYGLVAHHLARAGYGPGRVLVAMPLFASIATIAYGVVVGALGMRSEDATLNLIVAGFSLGLVAFFGVTTLTITAARGASARFMARFGPYLFLGYAQSVVLLVGFLVLSILGLA
jgi:hypothetical protein